MQHIYISKKKIIPQKTLPERSWHWDQGVSAFRGTSRHLYMGCTVVEVGWTQSSQSQSLTAALTLSVEKRICSLADCSCGAVWAGWGQALLGLTAPPLPDPAFPGFSLSQQTHPRVQEHWGATISQVRSGLPLLSHTLSLCPRLVTQSWATPFVPFVTSCLTLSEPGPRGCATPTGPAGQTQGQARQWEPARWGGQVGRDYSRLVLFEAWHTTG